MANLDPSKPKPPYNPYYLGAYYMLFQLGLAITVISLSSEFIHNLYILMQDMRLENILLYIHRPYNIKEYLFERGQVERWEMIAVYFIIFLITYIPMLLVVTIKTPKYLAWLSQVNASWQKPLTEPGWKGVRHAKSLGIFFILVCSWSFLFDSFGLAHSYRHNSIQLNNWGFFDTILSAGCFYLGVICLQFHYCRKWHNERLLKKLDHTNSPEKIAR